MFVLTCVCWLQANHRHEIAVAAEWISSIGFYQTVRRRKLRTSCVCPSLYHWYNSRAKWKNEKKNNSKLKVSNEIFNFVRGFFMQDLVALFDVMCFVHFPFWEYYSSELYMLLYAGCWLDSSWFLASGFSWIWKIDMKMKFGFAFGTTHVAEIQSLHWIFGTWQF